MPRPKADLGGGVFVGRRLCPRSIDPDTVTEKDRRRAVNAWIGARLDAARRSGQAPTLSPQKRAARARAFARELEFFFSASTGLPEPTATELRAIGEPIISAARKIVRGQTVIDDRSAYRQLGKMIATPRNSAPDHWRFRALQWITKEMRLAGWTGPNLLTVGRRLARYRREPTVDEEARAAIHAVAGVSLEAKSLRLPAGGSTFLQSLLRVAGPIYQEWTARSPHPPRDIGDPDADPSAPRLRHSLYAVLDDASAELTAHWAEPVRWRGIVKAGGFGKAARVLRQK
ncbi:MAG: hypothetical protein ABL308_05840 [Oceanicaulis sp.]